MGGAAAENLSDHLPGLLARMKRSARLGTNMYFKDTPPQHFNTTFGAGPALASRDAVSLRACSPSIQAIILDYPGLSWMALDNPGLMNRALGTCGGAGFFSVWFLHLTATAAEPYTHPKETRLNTRTGL